MVAAALQGGSRIGDSLRLALGLLGNLYAMRGPDGLGAGFGLVDELVGEGVAAESENACGYAGE